MIHGPMDSNLLTTRSTVRRGDSKNCFWTPSESTSVTRLRRYGNNRVARGLLLTTRDYGSGIST